jgi:hypothetical protein
LIDDTIKTDDAGFTPNTDKVVAVGMMADATSSDVVDEGDIGIPRITLDRRQIAQPFSDPENTVDGTASATGTSDTSVIAAPGAGLRLYITTIVIHNSSTTDAYVNIKDGSTTKLVVPAPGRAGAVINLPVPLRLTANTALQFASSASVTTMYVSAVGFKAVI